jgi:hypothetical protein
LRVYLNASIEHLNTAADYHLMTPLHAAVSQDHCSTVRILTAAGADVDAVDSDHMTPLHYAANGGHYSCLVVRSIRAVAVVNSRCVPTSNKRLHRRTVTVFSLSLFSVFSLATQWTDASATWLVYTRPGLLQTLMAAGADVSLEDGLGKTAYYYALTGEHRAIMAALAANS